MSGNRRGRDSIAVQNWMTIGVPLACAGAVSVAGGAIGLWGSSEMAPVTLAVAFGLMVSILGYVVDKPYLPTRGVAIAIATVGVMLLIGVYPRDSPVFGVNPSGTVADIIALGYFVLTIAVIFFGGFGRNRGFSSQILSDVKLPKAFHIVVLVALIVAVINYVTGIIPVFASDVNSTRFGTNFGLLAPLWPVVIAVMQSAVIVSFHRYLTKCNTRMDLVVSLMALTVLALSGARALVGIALLSCTILYIQIRRPRLIWIAASMIAAVGIFGLYGLWRAANSSGADESAAFLRARGLDNWLGSVDLSLQTGPRVLEMVYRLDFLADGRFFVGDLGNFLRFGYDLSDRYVTRMLGADPGAVGGLPPTLIGGFYLDWGLIGVVICPIILGIVLVLSQRWFSERGSVGSGLWSSYFIAYFIVSAYSYVSLKPTWIVVGCLCILLDFGSRKSRAIVSKGNNPCAF